MTSSPAPKLYHRRTPGFHGHVLYPLNRLRDVAPEMHDFHRAKYQGREQLCAVQVPYLNCLWNDVLHFSPVHPIKVRDLVLANRLLWAEADWFEIDPQKLGFTRDNSVTFLYRDANRSGYDLPPEEFEPYDIEHLHDMSEIPASTGEYFSQCSGGKYFIFVGIPHILHRGAIDTGSLPVIRA